MPEPETIESVLGTSWIAGRIARFPEEHRVAVQAIGQGALEPAVIARCLDALRVEDKDILRLLANAIALEDPDALLEVLLPGAAFADDVDVRLRHVYGVGTDWHGDLLVVPTAAGTKVFVGSARGALALLELDRDLRTPLVELVTVGAAATDPAVGRHLAALDLPGMRELWIDQMSGSDAAALVLRCPALEEYRGPMTVDVADAIATTSMKQLGLGVVSDDILARLTRSAHLQHLTIGATADRSRLTGAGLARLAALTSLRILHVNGCALGDDDLCGIAEIRQLEALMAATNPFGDGGGVALGQLAKLHSLDLHDTKIGDVTLGVLATLPQLEALDIASAPVTGTGLRALAACRTLAYLGLAWDCPLELDTAAATLTGVNVVKTDYMEDMGALFVRTAFDLLA